MDKPQSDPLELLVNESGRVRRVPLDKPALTIGRTGPVDIVLDDMFVSRQHARMYQDPFGRWIIEDLGSRNGLWMDGRRFASRALAVGEHVNIGPFVLSLCPVHERQIDGEAAATVRPSLAEDSPGAEIFATRVDADQNISGRRIQELNAIIDRLADVTSSKELYGEACRLTAPRPEATSLVLRLHLAGHDAEKPPEILACHRDGASSAVSLADAARFRVSTRVIEAVRKSPQPVQASNLSFSDGKLQLTAAEDDKPRVVLCVPIVVEDDWADVLYMEVPADGAGTDSLDFARAVGMQVNFARKSILLAEEKARSRVLDNQLSMAREIQSGLMPKTPELGKAVDLAVVSAPAMWVGGDHCDVWQLADGRIAFVVGDVAGKGLPAAMVMTNLQAALRTVLDFCPDLAEVVTHVSRHLQQHMPTGMFVTLFLGLLEPVGGRLEYANAGHILPLMASGGKVAALGAPNNPPLGIAESAYVTDGATMAPGDAIVVVTDGVTEARSAADEEFGCQRLQAVVSGMQSAASKDLVAAIAKAVGDFRGTLPQHDDMTVLALRLKP